MPLQPDLHYDGPLTVEYIDGLRDQLATAIRELEVFEPELQDDQIDWEVCVLNWMDSLSYANLRCVAVSTHIKAQGREDVPQEMQYENNAQLKADDHKCIDITLSILRDYQEAKNKKFLRE